MKRKIYLEGELADKFGKELNAEVSSVREAIMLIGANYPEFKSYLVDSHHSGVGFAIDVAGTQIDEEGLLDNLQEGDITIVPVPAGSKSGFLKIVAAIIILYVTIQTGGAALAAMMGGGGVTWGGAAALAGMTLGMSLLSAGIQQLMAPDPSVDEQGPQSYLFNGSEQNIIEGDPVPVLYGELRVPGRPISFAIANAGSTFSSNTSADQDQSSGSLTWSFSGGWKQNKYPVIQ